MSPNDFRSALKGLHVSQARLARLLHLNVGTPTRWMNEEHPIPREVELIVLLLASGAVTIEQLEAL